MNDYHTFLKEYPGIHLLEPQYCMEYYYLWLDKMERLHKLEIETDVELIRQELKSENPDGEKIFKLLCGDKYTEPIIKKK